MQMAASGKASTPRYALRVTQTTQRTDVDPRRRLALIAWVTLVLTVVVVQSGAFVRATESGAGCGETWPRCDGRIFTMPDSMEQAIELTHRLLTGVAGLAVALLAVWAWRHFAEGELLRRAATAVAILFGVEVVIGAMLVLFKWVDDDASIGRTITVPIHLMNTFVLLGAIVLTGYWASGGSRLSIDRSQTRHRLVLVGASALLIAAALGGLNALADTLYPADSLADALRADFGADAPVLLQLRVLHPAVAIAAGLLVFMIVRYLRQDVDARTERYGAVVTGLVVVQFASGFLNIALLTPVETQILHLVLADLTWIFFVLFGLGVLTIPLDADEGARAVTPEGLLG